MKNTAIALLCFLAGFSSCTLDGGLNDLENTDSDELPQQNVVYLLNEGQFNAVNASVGLLNFEDSTYTGNLFKTANGEALGDIAQSLYRRNGQGYLVVNNAQKIEVVDMASFERLTTITGITSPRYILPTSNSKAYVSQLFANQISMLDLDQNLVTGTIDFPGSAEQMRVVDGEVFVANLQSSYLYILDPATDQLQDSIELGFGTSDVVEDANGKIWVLATGDFLSIPASLHRVNPQTRQVELSIEFDAGQFPSRLQIGPNGNTLFFLNGGVFRMDISDNGLPDVPLIEADNRSLYGLGIHPRTGDILVTNAVDFVNEGELFWYNPAGQLIQQFEAGVVPGNMTFTGL